MLRLPKPTGRRAAWALMAGLLCALPASAADPDVLWKIVHNRCVPDQRRHHNPAPCEQVVLRHGVARGYVLLKDMAGATQYLVIPTARVTGIESPRLLGPTATNYWAPAWEARRAVFARAGRAFPRDAMSLAVNSVYGRSQNQLHIHVDCVRPDVRDYVVFNSAELPPRWTDWTVTFDGHPYLAMRLDGVADLGGINLFDMLAHTVPGAYEEMGNWSLVVVGLEPTGFVVFAGHVNPATGDRGAAEELQDHSCLLAQMLP